MHLPVLHSRFLAQERFRGAAGYRLLPMRFTSLDGDRVVVSGLGGEFLVLTREQLRRVVEHEVSSSEPMYADLVSRHMVLDSTDRSALDLLAAQYRTRHAHLSDFTALHLFVVTLRCDHSCPYCQVSRVSSDRQVFDMSTATADRAIDLVLRSPSPAIKVEFQGGEPLLNFELIRYVVAEAKRRTEGSGRDVQFVIATNLANLDDSMLNFMGEHEIQVSTSLDGPAELHNANRPRPGNDSYERAIDGIRRCRERLGHDRVSALMTTTMRTLEQPEAVIDEYVHQGFASIFLRWLSPYGFAAKTGRALGYPVEQWANFYERGLRYCLDLSRRGIPMREDYAAIVLRKMLTSWPPRYVDLQSPSGLGIAVAVYNYDGDVYASDEGRMLAETGDKSFRLGNAHTDTYEDIFFSDRLLELLDTTMTEAVPMCNQCAFEPYCGTDPTFHQATQGSAVGHRPTSAFCKRNMQVFRLLVRMMEDEPENRAILESWAC